MARAYLKIGLKKVVRGIISKVNNCISNIRLISMWNDIENWDAQKKKKIIITIIILINMVIIII